MPKKKVVTNTLPGHSITTTGTVLTTTGTTIGNSYVGINAAGNVTTYPSWGGTGSFNIPTYNLGPNISLKASDKGITIEMVTKSHKRAKITIPDDEVMNAMSAISDFLHSKGVNNKLEL